MGTKTVAQAVETAIAGLNDSATPTPNYYFDHVWLGKPENIPMGARAIAFVEVAQDPTFYYTTCNTATMHDKDILITLLSKGTVETATAHLYDLRDVVVNYIHTTPAFGSSEIIDSTIENIIYGDYIGERNNTITGCRITVKLRLNGD